MPTKKRIVHHPIVGVLGKRIRDARKGLGMSQAELAPKSGLTPNYVGKLERGEAAVGVDTLARLAAALQVDPGKLITTTEDQPHPLPALKDRLLSKINKFLTREDASAIQAVTILVGLADNALARRNL